MKESKRWRIGQGQEAGNEKKRKITSFRDLDVFLKSYSVSITVMRTIIPRLPPEEKYDLADQLRRSVKAIPPVDCRRLLKTASAKRFPEISR